MTDPELKALILGAVDDLVSDFLYYDRKGDGDLSADSLAAAIAGGVVSVEEIAARFAAQLKEGIG